MSVPFVDLKAQYESIKEEIDLAILEVIDNTSFVGGEIVAKFESEFAEYLGVSHCIGCGNGTDAIELALKTLGIGPGDEVLVPALTWVATAGAVSNVGAEPVFVDVLEDGRTIDPSLISAKITEKTKAIIPVHLYGLPARIVEIMTIAKTNNFLVIEDCAQAHGASIDGQKVGSFGDIATFSFYPGKNLGAYGDAGCVVTNNDKLAERCRRLGNHGQVKKHDHKIIGGNSRLDTIQAAVLSVKLRHLETWTDQRIALAKLYDQKLTGIITPKVPDGNRHVYHVYVVQVSNRNELMSKMKEQGIGCAIHYPIPLPFVEAYKYKNHSADEFPVSSRLCEEILSLPMYAEMGEEAVEIVFEEINDLLI